RAALDAEGRPQAGLADAGDRAPPDLVQRLRQPDGGQRFALTERRGIDARDHDVAAGGTLAQAGEDVERDLGLGVAVELDLVVGQPHLAGDVDDRTQRRLLRDLQVTLHHGPPAGRPGGPPGDRRPTTRPSYRRRPVRGRGWSEV